MEHGKERTADKKPNVEGTSGGTSESTDVPIPRPIRPTWSVTGVKGKVTDKCLWSACKAMTAGILLIAVGAGMATLGFYADQLSTVEETKGNTTVFVKNESKDTHLGSLTYLGPVVMGVGGFTIVAACVMTFEARDTAAKIVPIWFRRTRIHVVSGGSGSTPSGRSSKTSWERMLSQQRSSEDAADTRSAITQALVNFSKYLQSNVDTNKMPSRGPLNEHSVGIHKCPSEPNLTKSLRQKSDADAQESVALLEASTPQPTQRTSYGGGLKTMSRTTRPQLLSVAPDTYRQAVSMDCPRPVRLQRQEAHDSNQAETTPSIPLLIANGTTIQTLILQTSCTTSSSGSMSVDIYLPQGNVTLRVHDDMKDTSKRSPLCNKDSDESRSVRFSQQSDVHSFGEDDELYPETDDSVFVNQDPRMSAPVIVLDTLDADSEPHEQDFRSGDLDNLSPPASGTEQLSVEDWVTCLGTSPSREASIDSLEMNFSHDSPRSVSSTTPYSFDYSDLDSPGLSITSVVSNPQSSKTTEQNSLSQAESSFINVSSLNSMDSTQDIFSPLAFTSSPREIREPQFFPMADQAASEANFSRELVRTLLKSKGSSNVKANDQIDSNDNAPQQDSSSQLQQVSIDIGELGTEIFNPNVSPRKHASLESSEIITKKQLQMSTSPKRQQHSLGSSDNVSATDPATGIRFLSPRFPATSGHPTSTPRAIPHSPRKTRSESLPERRAHGKSASLKRFPLLRQVALDAFAEEAGSTHRMDRCSRSQSQSSTSETIPPAL